MSLYGGSTVGAKAIWTCATGYHAQYYGGPLIVGVPIPMDVQEGAPSVEEAAPSAGKKKSGMVDLDD